MHQSKDITHCLEAGECVMYFSTTNTMYPHSPGKSLEKKMHFIFYFYMLWVRNTFFTEETG